MPVVSTFFGIIVRMYFDDHAPPHFHAEYQGERAAFAFDGTLIAGHMRSVVARRLIEQWARDRQSELAANWQRAVASEPLLRIPPLE